MSETDNGDLDREIDIAQSRGMLAAETDFKQMGKGSRDAVHRHLEVPVAWGVADRLQTALEDAEAVNGVRWTLRRLFALKRDTPDSPSDPSPEYADPIAAMTVARSLLYTLAVKARVNPREKLPEDFHTQRKEELLRLHGSALTGALQNIPIPLERGRPLKGGRGGSSSRHER